MMYVVEAEGLPREIKLVRADITLKVAPPVEPLTAREREALVVIAAGLSYEVGAQLLFMSVRTLRSHASHIMDKFGVNTMVQAVTYALAAGVITWPEIADLWSVHKPGLLE